MKRIIYFALVVSFILVSGQSKIFAQDDNQVYNFVKMKNPPTYPGGMSKFYSFLTDNIKNPDSNIEGTVFASFVVEKDGTLNEIKVLRKLGKKQDEEAVRVLKLSKKWNPGIENGKPVRVIYNIPVRFH